MGSDVYVQCSLVPLPPLELTAGAGNIKISIEIEEEQAEPYLPPPQQIPSVSPTKYHSEGSFSEESSGPKPSSSPGYQPSSHSSDAHSDDAQTSPV